MVQNFLMCSSSNRIVLQFCSVNGGPAFNCSGLFDIGGLGLESGDHRISVFISDVFGQNLDFNLTARFVAPGIVYTCIQLLER